MKIHIVQKGDTLWKLAEQYGVDFETLKQANQHLSDPDQLSPGMKIKIPTSTGSKKESPKKGAPKKEIPKKQTPVTPSKKEVPKQPKVEKKKEEADYEQLKKLLKLAAPYVLKKLLKEEQPQLLQEIKIEIEMDQKQEMEQMYKKSTVYEPKHMPKMLAPPKQMPVQKVKPHMPPPPAPKKGMPSHAPSPYQAPCHGAQEPYHPPTYGYGGAHGCGCGPHHGYGVQETIPYGLPMTGMHQASGVHQSPTYGNWPTASMGYGTQAYAPQHGYHGPQYEHYAPYQKPSYLPQQMKRDEPDSREENE